MSQEINLFETSSSTQPRREAVTRKEEILQILEALLFSSSEPVSFDKLKEIISTSYPIRPLELKTLIEELRETYRRQKRAFQIDEIAEGYLLRTIKEVHPFVELLHQNRRGEKLSKAATEVLAIIAYKQPITRPQIEAIRGVDSSGTVVSLLERGLIEAVGRLEAPGRPLQYGVTARFLHYFGLKSINDLSRILFSDKATGSHST